jgi:hypothetical protein
VVVVVGGTTRETSRSLDSLSATYQRGVEVDEYEVVVVDRAAHAPLGTDLVGSFGANFRYLRADGAASSAAQALERGVAAARSDYLAILIDDAPILSPGVLRHGLELPRLFARPCGLVYGWRLGELLDDGDVPADGYGLFELAARDDEAATWLDAVAESHCTFVHRDVLARIPLDRATLAAAGDSDEVLPIAAELVRLDLQSFLLAQPDVDPVVILGEGVFRPCRHGHAKGGIDARTESRAPEWERGHRVLADCERSSQSLQPSLRAPHLYGHLPETAQPFLGPPGASVHAWADGLARLRRLHRAVMRDDEEARALRERCARSHAEVDLAHREVAALDVAIAEGHREVAALDAEIAALEKARR